MRGSSKEKPCDKWAEKLAQAQIEGLALDEQTALAEHVRSCTACANALARYQMMHTYLRRSLTAESLTEMPMLLAQRSRPRVRFPDPLALLPAVGIALLVGLLFLLLGQLITQIIAHVPGTPLAWTMPLTPLATALILVLFMITREALPAWNEPTTRSYIHSRPTRQRLPQTGRLLGEKKVAESASPLAHRRSWRYRGLLLIVILSLLAVSASSLAILVLNPSLIHSTNGVPTPVESSEPTGISIDGSQAFDITRSDGDLKLAAAARVRAHDLPGAQALWQQALAVDSGDAETRIYQEDQRVLASGRPYITLVVGTILGKGYISGGRDDLQGAYIAQHEYNSQVDQSTASNRSHPLLRLLVASSTFDIVSPAQVAHQVVEAARRDATIKGVMGWPTTASAQASLPILAAAHLPMLSASASGDTLTGQTPYFFRLSPTNTIQEEFAARYIKNILHAKRVALFEDPHDPFSRTLADAFRRYFVDADHALITEENYVEGHPEVLPELVKRAVAQHPDLLYFSGYASDVSMVLKNLPACTPSSCLLVMGGEAFYLQADYALDDLANYTRLRFTSFAFPGLWRIQHRAQPRFFQDYAQTFDPNGQYRPGTYGYNLPEGHTILSYDAIQVLLSASNTLPDRFTPEDLRRALTSITSAEPFQGVSGPIAFGPNGDNTLGKVMVLAGNIHGSPDGNIRLDYGEGVS